MIHVENLTKYYEDFCAVDQINLDIQKGEIVGLLGPNGAGKTTTLRMLTGYFSPSAGDIRVNDLSITENSLEIKRMIGYLPESAPLYHGMLVFDYLEYVANIRGVEKDRKLSRIKELSNLCGLAGIMHKTIGELSKGLRQRVGLAHALMNDPDILILDEPTSGLDPNQIVEIRKIIRQIGREKTIILSTHILSEAEATCDRIVIINKGKIVADGSTERIKNSAAGENVIHLSLASAPFDEVQKAISATEGVLRVEKSGLDEENIVNIRVSYEGGMDLREKIYHVIKGTSWVIMDFHQESLTLENIFRELTKEN